MAFSWKSRDTQLHVKPLATSCPRCWNKCIEKCGCDGDPRPITVTSATTKFCCDLCCFAPPTVKVEGIPCDICAYEGYCNCQCVQHRLVRFNKALMDNPILIEGMVYRVAHIERKLVEAPDFYQPLCTPQKFRYTPFYFLIITYHRYLNRKRAPSKDKEYKLILPPELTWTSLLVDGDNNSYEEILTNGKYLRFDNSLRFMLYPNLYSPLNNYNLKSDEFADKKECKIWYSWLERRDSFRTGMASIWPSNIGFHKKLDHIFDIFF